MDDDPMTDPGAVTPDPVPTADDLELAAAKLAAAVPPEAIPDAADLPLDVRDGDAEPQDEAPDALTVEKGV